jgi:hypothetical protein
MGSDPVGKGCVGILVWTGKQRTDQRVILGEERIRSTQPLQGRGSRAGPGERGEVGLLAQEGLNLLPLNRAA